jgi:hypothetical protein
MLIRARSSFRASFHGLDETPRLFRFHERIGRFVFDRDQNFEFCPPRESEMFRN